MSQAREDWIQTDAKRVTGYSYSWDCLQLNFGPLTLRITPDGPIVVWELLDAPASLKADCNSVSLLVNSSTGSEDLFDREAVLQTVFNNRIRYAPSEEQLFLVWPPDNDIAISSVPLEGKDDWILSYSRSY